MQTIFNSAHGLKILVIGDLILDHYVLGNARRLSPEAPVPVVLATQDRWALGGAANVALNLKSFGVLTEVIGAVGKDAGGERFKRMFAENNILFDERYQFPNISTISKTRILGEGQQICRVDREQAPSVYAISPKLVLEHLNGNLRDYNAIIFSDYAKGSITQDLLNEIVDVARKKRVFIAVDPKPRSGLNYGAPDLLTPNATESLQMAGMRDDISEGIDWNLVAKKIYAKHACKILAITLGAKGMALFREGQFVRHIPTYVQEVFDVSGAGDTVIAALTTALCGGASLELASHFANLAAGVVVGKLGTSVATPAEILNFQHKNFPDKRCDL